jgi:bacteriocin biosynthesis cyclodehydratase domain-containing protein
MRTIDDTAQPPLPALLVLAEHRPLLHRGPTVRVIGLGPGTALVVDDLSPPLAALVDALTAPVGRDRLLARAAAAGADPAAAAALLADLVAAGAVVDARSPGRVARYRAEAVVRVHGDGPLAVGVAAGLGRAGVGTVHVAATGPVHAADLGTGYLDADRGRPRSTAAAAAVLRIAPGTRVGAPSRRAPDLVVLADTALPDAVAARSLHAEGVAHLHVGLRDGRGVVGPLVLPGRSACLECLEHRRTEQEPGWPLLAAQLAGVRGTADAATAVATAGLAIAQALAALDGAAAAPATVDATLELDPGAGSLVRRTWAPHPRCPCAAGAGSAVTYREAL